MRKKSHLALAGFLIQGMDHEVLNRRWRSFYFGNILPDCKPSFVTVRHEYDGTFDMMAEMLRALVSEEGYWSIDTAGYMMDLGQVFHYIADYFNSKSWYKGTVEPETFDADTSVFNEYEVANIQKIADTEGKLRSEGK